MRNVNHGGSAFPGGLASVGDGDSAPYCAGMILRDWFAGQALAWAGHHNWMSADPNDLAKRAYQMADAMIAARECGAK